MEAGKKQLDVIYYMGHALLDAETRYLMIEKMALALVISARKLRPYFQAHTIVVLINQSLRQVIQKPEASARLVQLAVELGEHDIQYQPRTIIKGQAATNFMAEFTSNRLIKKRINSGALLIWKLYVDGSSSRHGSRAGLILVTSENIELSFALRFGFQASNNERNMKHYSLDLDGQKK